MMQLAQLLHSRGLFISFVNTEFNHRRLIRSKGPDSVKGLPDFRFETIPDGLPSSNSDATQDVRALSDSTRKNCLAPFLELLSKINSTPQLPNATCIVSDGVMSFMGYLHFTELVKSGIFPFQNETFLSDGTLDKPIDWIPGMSNIRLKDMPSFIRANNPYDILFDFMGSEVQNCLKASAIIFNTFDEFEHEVLKAIAATFPRIYTTGPLHLLVRHMPDGPSKSMNSSLWKEDAKCIEWLNKREPNSVVYVNYGSITVMSEKHLKEFAWGLANNFGKRIHEGDKGKGSHNKLVYPTTSVVPPSGWLFLTHCGWNSLMEAVTEGVPLICWPFFADQHTNCRYSCTTWGMGMEINPNVRAEDVEALVKEMMEGDNGQMIRRKALDWKNKAEAAVCCGGSSLTNFDRMMKEAINHG
ncbi:UDP-glucosyl transferase 85A2 [Hibiscus syriacus]|uniref:UDP-glucosyl transferase 85A2 n=1 Tax=Hibiscus syriacus TaxID=106335 RepID=A0A6A3AT53_HIBSY|nr:UDP-glucosyl transferase 85A2 [Hibiscus syriacus]